MPLLLIARYRVDGVEHFGRRDGQSFVRMTAPPWADGRETDQHDPVDACTLLAPVTPSKIVCVGLNYQAHIAESLSVVPGARAPVEPVLFLKPPSAVIPSGGAIRYPPRVTRLHPEAERAAGV